MQTRDPIKVFISWSLPRSKRLARALRHMVQDVLGPGVVAWMSDRDITLGEVWEAEITSKLATADLGLACLTPENLYSPWLYFECGAITNRPGGRLIPLLFQLDYPDLNFTPLAGRQGKGFSRDDIECVLESIVGRELTVSEHDRFGMDWPGIQEVIDSASQELPVPQTRGLQGRITLSFHFHSADAAAHLLGGAEHSIEAMWSPFEYSHDDVQAYYNAQLDLLKIRDELEMARYIDVPQVSRGDLEDHVEKFYTFINEGRYSLFLCPGPLTGALRVDKPEPAAGIFVQTHPDSGKCRILLMWGSDSRILEHVERITASRA